MEPDAVTPEGLVIRSLPGLRAGFRRMAPGKLILGGFLASEYVLGYRVVDSPVANMYTTPIQKPVAKPAI